MADQKRDQGRDSAQRDAADPRQTEPRRGLEGKGYDAGGGYGGAGNDSLYSAESSYGGQSGVGGNSQRGAYAGDKYGRQDDSADEQPDGSASQPGAHIPRGSDEHSGAPKRDGDPSSSDVDAPLDAERREPGQ